MTTRSRATMAGALALLAGGVAPRAIAAQRPATGAAAARPAATSTPVAVGALAPDFSLTGATRYGLLRSPVRLSDFRGETVVLAFFYQARTKG